MAFSPGEDTGLREYAPSSSTSSASERDGERDQRTPSWGPLWHPQELHNDLTVLVGKFRRSDWYANLMRRIRSVPFCTFSSNRRGVDWMLHVSWPAFVGYPYGQQLRISIKCEGAATEGPRIRYELGDSRSRVMHVNFRIDIHAFPILFEGTLYPSFINMVNDEMMPLTRGSPRPDVAQALYLEDALYSAPFLPSVDDFVEELLRYNALDLYTGPYIRLMINMYSDGTVEEVILHRTDSGTLEIITRPYTASESK